MTIKNHLHSATFAGPNAGTHYPVDLPLEPVHLEMDLRLNIPARRLEATVITTVVARCDTLESLTLYALDFEEVSITDPDGKELSASYDGKEIRARWGEVWLKDEERRLSVSYVVENPVSGLFFSSPDEAYPEEATYAATDHETERARHWLPCVDLPQVRTSLDIRITSDQSHTILANGLLFSEEENNDGTKTARWVLKEPCPSYLVCFAVGDFVKAVDGEHQGVEFAYFTSPAYKPEDLIRSFGRSGDMMAWMTKKLGMDFPYPKYYQFALPGFGGAMENISLVSWHDIFVLDEEMAPEWTWLVDQINVHEMAHSYFGDLVVCRDYAQAWLKESWATYIESCWLEDSKGADEQRYNLYADAHAYFGESDGSYARPIMTRVFDSSWDMYDYHLYPGGACRLHTLRCELGDRAFWAGVKDYLKIYAHKVVETEDFRRVMEKHSGRSLVQFFDQWIYTAGYPKLKASFSYDDKAKVGTFEIEQTQVDKDNKPFVLRLDLGWALDKEGDLETRPVKLDQTKHYFSFPMDKDPSMVRVGPNGKALHKLSFNPGDEKLRTQLVFAKDVVGRIQAGLELVETGKRKNLEEVLKAYQQEPFWGVRLRWGKALAGANSRASVEALVECVRTEKDPMVMSSLFGAAGQIRDPQLAEALEARLKEGLPPRAKEAAWISLGKQRNAASVETLMAGAAEEGIQSWAQSGALKGLAHTRSKKALPFLLEKTVYGSAPKRARVGAALALGILGKSLHDIDKEALTERLVDLLRDQDEHMRMAAARSLGALKAQGAVGALQGFKNTLTFQDQVAVHRLIQGIQKPRGNDTSALEKKLESAEKKLQELADKIEKMEALKKSETNT